MQLTQYDPLVLQVFVEDRYREAKWIIVTTTLKYAAATFAVSFLIYIGIQVTHLVTHEDAEGVSLVLPILVVIAALLGLAAGRAKAWELKFDAQKVLLQMQIEKNTSRVIEVSRATSA
jgi:hypothetical protein